MKKTLLATIFGALFLVASINAATTADVIFVVDESGSMGGEHAWLGSMISSLDAGLIGAGVTGNQYALVGYGEINHATGQVAHKHSVGGGDFGTAAQFSTATGGLQLYGGYEDGYQAIDFALNNYTVRSGAALNVILVTDEDRDGGAPHTYASILAQLQAKNAYLNAVVNATYSNGAVGTYSAYDSTYLADGSGGFTKSGAATVSSDFGTTKEDYVDLALATGGAGWDLNKLRVGGNTAISFTNAFVDLKVQEIIEQQPTVPEPGTIGLLGLGLVALVGFSRRKKA